jgi:hypothetical protein
MRLALLKPTPQYHPNGCFRILNLIRSARVFLDKVSIGRARENEHLWKFRRYYLLLTCAVRWMSEEPIGGINAGSRLATIDL